MTEQCPRMTEPSQCLRCRALAQELLSKADLAKEEHARVKELLMKLRDDNPIEDPDREYLNELAVRYL